MKRLLLFLPLVLMLSCVNKVDVDWGVVSLDITFTSTPSCGMSEDDKCDFSLEDGSFTINVEVKALKDGGQVNTDFSKSVVLSTVPAGIFSVDDPTTSLLPDGRRVKIVKLENGIKEVPVTFKGAFGEIRIFVEDVGYEPAENALTAACHDIYPAGGCYSTDDDNIESGTGAAGVSEPLYFYNPRIKDLQKPTDESQVGNRNGDKTPLDGFRVQIDGDKFTGVSDCAAGEARLVVTQVGVAGFYVTDVCNRADPNNVSDPIISDYSSIYVYNFNTPEDMYRGDCLLMFQGAIDEFQGFTEMKNPFWQIDVCDDSSCTENEPKCRDQLPDPVELTSTMLNDPLAMEKLESGLVKVTNVVATSEFRICDKNGDGVIDYNNYEEDQCKSDCGDEVGCVVKEDFDEYFTWTVDVGGEEVGVVTRGVVSYDPERSENLGTTVYSITGTIKHLSFGSPAWIILPRDPEDFCLTAQDCGK